MNLEVKNSFCRLVGDDISSKTIELVSKLLTFRNDIAAEKAQLFFQLKLAERKGNRKLKFSIINKIKHLEQNEYVYWFNRDDNSFPTGHLNLVEALFRKCHIEYSLVDLREKPSIDLFLNWNNKPFEPRDYQKNAIKAALAQGRGVIESAVGTGKSLMAGYIIKELSVNTLFVVPSRGLSDQLFQDFKSWFGSGKVEIINSSKVKTSKSFKPIRIVTVQTLASLNKSRLLDKLILDINCICIDEFHRAASDSYLDLLPEISHIYYRFGFTGTFLRNDAKTLSLWGFLSNVLYKYPAEQAIKDGYLTPLTVKVYNIPGKPSRSYRKEYEKNYCGNNDLLETIMNIHSDPKYLNSQILTLISQKEKSGKIIHEYLNLHGINNTYISGDTKKEEITKTISEFNDKNINYLIGSGVIGEGIDIRSTDHMIMAQGGKSPINIVQAVGRAIRLYEGKSMAYVHDFNFEGTKYMSKHLQQRLELYKNNFGCKIEYIDW